MEPISTMAKKIMRTIGSIGGRPASSPVRMVSSLYIVTRVGGTLYSEVLTFRSFVCPCIIHQGVVDASRIKHTSSPMNRCPMDRFFINDRAVIDRISKIMNEVMVRGNGSTIVTTSM